jgi:glucokinase
MKKDLYLIIDIGGTKIALGFFNKRGKLLATKTFETKVSAGPSYALNKLYQEVGKFLVLKGSLYRIVRVCVACPGPFDRSGTVLRLPNLASWRNFPLVTKLKKRFNVPVMIENDANLAALGEALKGSGKGYKNVLYVTYSTGIGGGFVHSGKIWKGSSGDAFEVGHITVDKDGAKCGCGKFGCLEASASGRAIESLAKKAFGKNLNTQTVLAAAKKGNRTAERIWNEALEYFAIGLSNIIQLVNPQVIVIGGGISKDWGILAKGLKRKLKKYTWERPLKNCSIVKARLKLPALNGGFLLISGC